MKTAGVILTGVGFVLAMVAIALMPTTASYSDVLNIGLLQQQQLVFLGGCTLFLAGIVLWAAGLIEERLLRIFRRLAPGTISAPDDVALSSANAPDPYVADRVDYNEARNPDDDWGVVAKIVGAIVAIGIIVGLLGYLGRSPRSSDAAAIEMNADMLADNMEMAADNMDATR